MVRNLCAVQEQAGVSDHALTGARRLATAAEPRSMKPSAVQADTSRGPVVGSPLSAS
jgi:hypothetical protein